MEASRRKSTVLVLLAAAQWRTEPITYIGIDVSTQEEMHCIICIALAVELSPKVHRDVVPRERKGRARGDW